MALDVDDVVKHVVMIVPVVVNVKKDALASSLMVVTHRRDVGRRVVLVSQGTTEVLGVGGDACPLVCVF
jgi:hypothetical protein